mmetsp:Transcript_9509/g.20857  ORF Transcript_9509/g.20857 Transcript_9509/m.20857 type:complete len:207 (+) Transcript_9509:2221-2841(+)
METDRAPTESDTQLLQPRAEATTAAALPRLPVIAPLDLEASSSPQKPWAPAAAGPRSTVAPRVAPLVQEEPVEHNTLQEEEEEEGSTPPTTKDRVAATPTHRVAATTTSSRPATVDPQAPMVLPRLLQASPMLRRHRHTFPTPHRAPPGRLLSGTIPGKALTQTTSLSTRWMSRRSGCRACRGICTGEASFLDDQLEPPAAIHPSF